jgi:hypothetical protein
MGRRVAESRCKFGRSRLLTMTQRVEAVVRLSGVIEDGARG